jgi:putative membrane protein
MRRAAIIATIITLATAPAAFAQSAPTDPQIAHIAYTAGQIDIAAAEQALRKSTTPIVVEFATQMANDHQSVNDEAIALVQRLGVTPEDNATSQALAAAATAKAAELEALSGAAFDAAYLANEIAFHQTVNGALADLLIPSAQNAELKVLLETGLALFTEHQTHAEHLATQLP